MSKLYSIQESTLTDIGDALRSKYGETKPGTIQMPCVISKTSTATGPNAMGTAISSVYSVVSIPGATKIEVNLYYSTQTFAKVYVASGEYKSNIPKDIMYQGGSQSNIIETQLTFEDTDVITFYWECSFSGLSGLGYYAECIGYDADGNPIEVEGCNYKEQEIEVKNTYSSADVAAAIDGLSLPFGVEPIEITGNQQYGCAGPISSSYINLFGDTISTNNVTGANYMFHKSTVKKIPFEINMKTNSNISMNAMFGECYNLESLPKINNCRVYDAREFLKNCYKLKSIPEDYFNNLDWSYLKNQTSTYYGDVSNLFNGCKSLRKIPTDFLANMNTYAPYSYSYYYAGFGFCLLLDELVNLPVPYTNATWTGNAFSSFVNQCTRLKRLTFATQEDGSPIVVKWKSQTIDLTQSIGRGLTKATAVEFGLSADKFVSDDASYQALKNDPDWYCQSTYYSRYNRDSAVETINSLPDTSAYLATQSSGTNTIKFTRLSGLNTDGGAIENLTEEEIAVAAAKGWTVSFVS